MSSNATIQDIQTGLRISLSDLLHEWKLSLCLVLAIAAVVAPLLLLFGLKYGTIETLRYRLVQDPKNREIKITTTKNYQKEWFEEIAKRPDIAFVLPTTRGIAASLKVRLEQDESRQPVELDIVPTGSGDTLLLENDGEIPGEGQCTLTRFAAEMAGAKIGDRLQCTINRHNKAGKYETVSFPLEVRSILSDRAGNEKHVYVTMELLEAVEAYKDGRSVTRYDWPGELPTAYPLFDGFILLFAEPLPKGEQLALAVGTGLSKIREIRNDEAPDILGFPLPDSLHGYLLQVYHTPVGQESLDAVREKLRGRNAIVTPYVKPVKARISHDTTGQSSDLTVLGYWANAETLQQLGQADLTPFVEPGEKLDPATRLRIILPSGNDTAQVGETVFMTFTEGARSLTFPVAIAAKSERVQVALLPSDLIGIVNTLRQREVFFDDNEKDFLLGRMSYAGARMYARSIDDVEPLRLFLMEQGIEADTKAKEIEQVKSMDRGLTRVFWLVATVGILGCMAALVASLASSVERKKRDLSVLRLMGISGWLIFQVPVTQAVFLGCAGFLAAIGGFSGIAAIINHVFAKDLMPGERMCTLALNHFSMALLGTLTVVFLSSLFSAWQATRIDPAEALRDE